MSNFLTNLVTRSLAPAPDLLRPKLPSLFEAPAGGEPILEDEPGIPAREKMVATDSVPPTRKDPRFERYHAEEEREIFHQREPIHKTSESPQIVSQTILPRASEKPTPTSIEVLRAEHVRAASTIRVESEPNEGKHADGPRSEVLTRLAKENDRTGSDQEIVTRLMPLSPQTGIDPAIPLIENNMDAKLFPVEDKSPTVRIHIGRIEVRAVTQPSPPARAATPQRPKMTLDDYLHRRNEGKR